jgi:hypothetical protein
VKRGALLRHLRRFLSVGVTGDARVVVVDAPGRADSLRENGRGSDGIPGCTVYAGGTEETITFVGFESAALGHYDFWISPKTDEGRISISWIGSTKSSQRSCEGSLLLTGILARPRNEVILLSSS